ncbi:MAG: signal peptidase I [Defluviitaleaceae bacterium]|nr:signal peptidase I [Defluviitaleaceae bacterium]
MLKKITNDPVVRIVVNWAIAIAIALFAYLLLDNFVVKSARIQGPSMEPTLYHGDRVFVNRLAFVFRQPGFGDIVAFPGPANHSESFIKRVVGLPGDVINIVAGYIYRNGQRLDCVYFQGQGYAFAGTTAFPVTVGESTFFVLGDNLGISRDSRFAEVGNVHRDQIIGRVNFRWLPLSRFGAVN